MRFPTYRARRLRESIALRRLVQETRLAPREFILPLFVVPGHGIRQEISSCQGSTTSRWIRPWRRRKSVVDHRDSSGIAVWIAGGRKDPLGQEAYSPTGAVQQAVRAIKQAVPRLMVITDVCLCEYTDHGHCGVVQGERIVNDLTLELLRRTALSHVEAGADMVAPSDMMDGRVGAIREFLDDKGYQ